MNHWQKVVFITEERTYMRAMLCWRLLALFGICTLATTTWALEACPANCVDSECSALGCVQCDEGFYLYPDPNAGKSVCIESCPDGYYTNPVSWCEECETVNCAVCSDEYTCTECKPGYEVNKDGDCVFSSYRV
ncbi:proprotein convertase subtilisin/kexin type 5-like [Liolophura sinensis]|uniref:proprotein convertase subtilisin/kexin type 5-like n=1 Tax=Liolophura sinensis TaxID=3198878 RepID=UPI003158327B